MPISRRYLVTSTFIFLVIGALALLGLVGATVWLSQRAQIDAETEARLVMSLEPA